VADPSRKKGVSPTGRREQKRTYTACWLPAGGDWPAPCPEGCPGEGCQTTRVGRPPPDTLGTSWKWEDGEGALLLTYSAATPTRVTLLLAGFYVGAGVSTGTKGETTVAATRRAALGSPLGERWLERWRRSSSRAPHGQPLTPEAEARVLAYPQWSQG